MKDAAPERSSTVPLPSAAASSYVMVAALQLAHLDELAADATVEAQGATSSNDAWWTAIAARRIAFDMAVQLDALDRRPTVESVECERKIDIASKLAAAQKAELEVEKATKPASTSRLGVCQRLARWWKGDQA